MIGQSLVMENSLVIEYYVPINLVAFSKTKIFVINLPNFDVPQP